MRENPVCNEIGHYWKFLGKTHYVCMECGEVVPRLATSKTIMQSLKLVIMYLAITVTVCILVTLKLIHGY